MPGTPLAALALGLALAAAPPAVAGNDSELFSGDCGYHSVTDPTWQVGDPDRYQGVLYGYAVVYSPSGPATPVTATVTCTLSVDGEPVGVMDATGTTVVAGTVPVDFVATPEQYVGLCLSVDFADDTPTYSTCYESIPWQIPPQELYDLVWEAPSLVPGLHETVCAVLRTGVVPDVGRTLSTGGDGDLYVAERRLVDCPPQG